MVKAYLRYEPTKGFGVIYGQGNIRYLADGKSILSPSAENVSLWNVKQDALMACFEFPASSSGSDAPPEATCLDAAPHGGTIAVGYADGSIRIWDLKTATCSVTLKGHKAGVTTLRYSSSGALLVSGSKDTDIILWDVASEAGLFRLRGHTDQVTDLVFLEGPNLLVSSSKDSCVRVWDLDTQHCVQTLTHHKNEVWALALDAEQKRLVAGSSDQDLHMYAVASSQDVTPAGGVKHEWLSPMGTVPRVSRQNCTQLQFHTCAGGTFLAAACAGKSLELFRVRPPIEAKKKLQRRKRRKVLKAQKKAEEQGKEGLVVASMEVGEEEPSSLRAADELEAMLVIALKAKLRSFDFNPRPTQKGWLMQMAFALADNTIDVVDVKSDSYERVSRIHLAGHRADIRAVALSSDDQLLATTSSSELKVWNVGSSACLSTLETSYGLCTLFAPGNKHVVVGTKEGSIELFDLGSSDRCHLEKAHTGAIWTLAALPDKTGFISGGADKQVMFWSWDVEVGAEGGQVLRISHERTLSMADDVMAVKVSPDGRLVAVALLDSTIKVFFLDSLKFFLSLYGHKLPVLTLDISSDSTLLVSGSADKNIKIWGLDFGDCHKSLFAHGDAVTGLAFVPNTHYCFSVGKDGLIKYWDVDRFEMLMQLGGHQGGAWGLAVSSYGDMLITVGKDRSIRMWERTSEPFFVEEEREKRLESLFEADLEDRDARAHSKEGAAEGQVAPAGRKTLETVGAADSIIDALDMAAHERDRIKEHAAEIARDPKAKPPPINPLMMGMGPSAYVLRIVTSVKSADLETALLMLPFNDALKLLGYIPLWLKKGGQVETVCRVAILLIRLHQSQLVATPSARSLLLKIQRRLRRSVQGLKDTLGYNLAAMSFLQGSVKGRLGSVASQPAAVVAARKQVVGSDQDLGVVAMLS